MRMWIVAAGAGAAIACVSVGFAQRATGPTARYVMDVSTSTGMGGANAMSIMMGRAGGGSETRALELRLGSALGPTGGVAKADHFMPDGMRLGPSVPLVTPITSTEPTTRTERDPQQNFQRPKGRMLLFWGCGAHAGPGQPVILDFAKLAQGQIPPNLFTTRVPVVRDVTQSNSRTYGSWPNSQGRKTIARDSSLIGEHRITGNYAPEIKFALGQDFMPALRGSTTARPDNATDISWNSVAAATGYYAHGIGFNGEGRGDGGTGDIVWWTSSSAREFGGGLWDYLPPATVARLVSEKVVMPPTQTHCTIPAEVKAAGGAMMMLSLYAYGPEANFAFPPRPANPRVAWNPEWTTKVRYRATTNMFVGMPGMGAEASDDAAPAASGERPRKRCKGGLGGAILGSVLGGGGC